MQRLLESAKQSELTDEQWLDVIEASRLVETILDEYSIEMIFERASDKQRRFADDFASRRYNVFAAIGGNRSGKSIVGGPMCFIKHVRDHATPGSVYWCVAPTGEKSVSGQQKLFYDCLPKRMLGKQGYDEKTGFGGARPTLIVEPDGRRVVVRFKAASQYEQDPRSFEQEQVSGIWIDESVKESLYNTCLPRVWDLNGFVIITAIPDAAWMFQALAKAGPEKKILFEKFCMMDNAHNLAPGAVQRAINEMTDDEVAMRVYGDFRFIKGLVYPFIDDYYPNGHLLRPFEIPAEVRRWRTIDFGMSHPTVCLWAACLPDKFKIPGTELELPDDALVVYREYRSVGKTCDHDAKAIVAASAGEKFTAKSIIDRAAFAITKANVRSVARQFKDSGLPCAPSVRTQKYGEYALVQKVKRRLEQKRILVVDSCLGLRREFGSWMYKLDRDGNPLGSDMFEDKNNDALDALKYLEAVNPSNRPVAFRILSGGSSI